MSKHVFSSRSLKNLEECHPDLQRVMHRALKYYDFSVIQGYRGKEKQNEYYRKGTSQLQYPESLHNRRPALAVDVIPYPTGFQRPKEFNRMATYIFRAALEEGVHIKWGGHWSTLLDMPHFELVGYDDE